MRERKRKKRKKERKKKRGRKNEKNKIAVTDRQIGLKYTLYRISIETAKGGPRTLDWAQGLALG